MFFDGLVAVPVLPDILPEMVDNVSQANGFLFGIYALGLMFGGFVFGGLSDRYQVRQVPMCILLLVLGVATLLFGIAKEYYQLLIARLIQGLAGGGTWAIGFGMILDMNSPSKSIAILGSVMACSSMGTLLGPTLGGFLYEGGGRMAPFVFGGCLAFLDLILRLFIGETAGWKERQAEIEAEEEAARQAAKMASVTEPLCGKDRDLESGEGSDDPRIRDSNTLGRPTFDSQITIPCQTATPSRKSVSICIRNPASQAVSRRGSVDEITPKPLGSSGPGEQDLSDQHSYHSSDVTDIESVADDEPGTTPVSATPAVATTTTFTIPFPSPAAEESPSGSCTPTTTPPTVPMPTASLNKSAAMSNGKAPAPRLSISLPPPSQRNSAYRSRMSMSEGAANGWDQTTIDARNSISSTKRKRRLSVLSVNVQRKPTTVREMMTSWQLVMCFLTTMAASLSTTSLETVLPLHLKDRLGLSAGPIGLLFMAAVIPNAIVSPVMGWLMSRFHWDRHLVMSCSILYLAAMLPLTSLPTQVWTQVIVLLFTGFGLASVLFSPTPHMIHYMSENSNDCYALLSAINNVFYAGGMLVGPILSGALYERMSFLNCMLILIAFLITLSIIISSHHVVAFFKSQVFVYSRPTESGKELAV
ncbi:hypothetical protein H4R33_000622 [Dimargaris cristalligena]|nr:hypothetical protein H4R33_000622 [Dimargaris cristalligena]